MKNWSGESERACCRGRWGWGWQQACSIPVCRGVGRHSWPHPLRRGNYKFLCPSQKGRSRRWGDDHKGDTTSRSEPYGLIRSIFRSARFCLIARYTDTAKGKFGLL